MKCSTNWYGRDCNTYCVPNDDESSNKKESQEKQREEAKANKNNQEREQKEMVNVITNQEAVMFPEKGQIEKEKREEAKQN